MCDSYSLNDISMIISISSKFQKSVSLNCNAAFKTKMPYLSWLYYVKTVNQLDTQKIAVFSSKNAFLIFAGSSFVK